MIVLYLKNKKRKISNEISSQCTSDSNPTIKEEVNIVRSEESESLFEERYEIYNEAIYSQRTFGIIIFFLMIL